MLGFSCLGVRHLGYYRAGVAGVGKRARRSGPGLVLVDRGTLLERAGWRKRGDLATPASWIRGKVQRCLFLGALQGLLWLVKGVAKKAGCILGGGPAVTLEGRDLGTWKVFLHVGAEQEAS